MVQWEEQALSGITKPHENDVLMGRGNGAKDHKGNQQFRAIVDHSLPGYVECPKQQRKQYAEGIIVKIRQLDPPGRFLVKDKSTSLWADIGYDSTLRKVRQRFREVAPELEDKKKKNPTVAAPPVQDIEPNNLIPSSVEPVASAPPFAAYSTSFPSDYRTNPDDDIDDDEISMESWEPLPIEEDPLGPIDLHSSLGSVPENNLQANQNRRASAEFMLRQNGSLSLETEVKLMRSDHRMGKRNSLLVSQDSDGTCGERFQRQNVQRQNGSINLSESTMGTIDDLNAVGITYDESSDRSNHIRTSVPLNDEGGGGGGGSGRNSSGRSLRDRARFPWSRSKFSRSTVGSSTNSGGSNMAVSIGTISVGSQDTPSFVNTVFEEQALPDGNIDKRQSDKMLTDSLKGLSEMSLDDVSTSRAGLADKQISGLSVDHSVSVGVNPTPLRELMKSNLARRPGSLTLSQAASMLGTSGFSATTGASPTSNNTLTSNQAPSDFSFSLSQAPSMFSEVSLDGESKI
uniref:DUF6824 domain-containing protein n=1 Tax=Ditylum brightwellii TaxID=49249 RepID=A0A7S4S1I0_9STRA